MIRVFLIFSLIFGIFWIGIPTIRSLSGLEKWNLTKTIGYAILCAVLTLLVLIGIVILF
jgi:hypothetical protein